MRLLLSIASCASRKQHRAAQISSRFFPVFRQAQATCDDNAGNNESLLNNINSSGSEGNGKARPSTTILSKYDNLFEIDNRCARVHRSCDIIKEKKFNGIRLFINNRKRETRIRLVARVSSHLLLIYLVFLSVKL